MPPSSCFSRTTCASTATSARTSKRGPPCAARSPRKAPPPPPITDHRSPITDHSAPLHLASLYNSGVPALTRCPAEHWFAADPARAIGAQARLFSRACAAALLPHLTPGPEFPDLQAARLADALGLGPLFFRTPSLVQHTGTVSLWGGLPHSARDFDETWRA